MKISESELINRGFAEYQPSEFDSCNKCYQKRYRDKEGHTAFFLDVKHYELVHPTTKEDMSGDEVSGQFYLKGNHNAVNMSFLDSTVDEVEQFITSLFEAGLLENYE